MGNCMPKTKQDVDDVDDPTNHDDEGSTTKPSGGGGKDRELQMRRDYAEAFLARCSRFDAETESGVTTAGTYLFPWLQEGEKEETFYECPLCGAKGTHAAFDTIESFGDHRMRCRPDDTTSYQLRRQYYDDFFEGVQKTGSVSGSNDICHEQYADMEFWASFEEPKFSLPLSGVCLNEAPVSPKLQMGRCFFQAGLIPKETSLAGYAVPLFQASVQPGNDRIIRYEGKKFTDTDNRWAEPITVPVLRRSESYLGRLGLATTCYTKDRAFSWRQHQNEHWEDEEWYDDEDRAFVPFEFAYRVPSDGVNFSLNKVRCYAEQHGGSQCDVWSSRHDHTSFVDATIETEIWKNAIVDVVAASTLAARIKPILDRYASQTNDHPLPRYQMIIDPNKFVRRRKSDGQFCWVPCEFDISDDGSQVRLVGGARASRDPPALIDAIATPVLKQALPLLSKLKKPHLLLEGRRLQVVVKAQAITVPKKQEEDDIQEYVGLWHVDGEHEAVVAVVLFYYDVDEALEGGDMEFLDRKPFDVLGYGDAPCPRDFREGALRWALRPSDGDEAVISNCRVPVSTGTMIVFSNYQMAHRVLRMVNTSTKRDASRKFVALFVMDPAATPLVPARCHLARQYLYQRSLGNLPDEVAQLILEYTGQRRSEKECRLLRNQMLRSQLVPRSHLSASQSMVFSTGNGCATMIGWIDNVLRESEERSRHFDHEFDRATRRISALNRCPAEVGRGLSETLSIPSDQLEDEGFNFLHDMEDLNNKLMDKIVA